MSKLIAIFFFLFIITQHVIAQKQVSPVIRKELETAEVKMFDGIVHHNPDYFKNDVAVDFFSINADGTTQTKTETLADTLRGKYFSEFIYKLLDKKIRVYDNVGIINGRAQAYMKDKLMVEFLYTAIFVKQNDRWIYTSWQGTLSKDSPKPPEMPKN